MPFPCAQCGECCRHIDKIPQLAAFDMGNGVCVHLCENRCSIYESRPVICRVDVMYENYFSKYFDREEFYEANEAVCRTLKNAGSTN